MSVYRPKSKRKHTEGPVGRISLQCRIQDANCVELRDFGECHPIDRGECLSYWIPWSHYWFDPSMELGAYFCYVGVFESREGRLLFACDGKELASVTAWFDDVREMKTNPPKRPDGTIDSERLELFQQYWAIRERAYASIFSDLGGTPIAAN